MQAGRENRPHIGIYGRCNAGKSSLLNFITGAETAIVSPEAGTTTDVVRKSYEILGFAPVVWLDTAGVDDSSELGRRRVARTWESLLQVDLALLVFRRWGEPERELVRRFERLALPYLLADVPVTAQWLAGLGNGGLCLNCPECHYPNCGFGKGS